MRVSQLAAGLMALSLPAYAQGGTTALGAIIPDWKRKVGNGSFATGPGQQQVRQCPFAAGSGRKFGALAGPRQAIAGWWRCPRRDSSCKTGASNHALRTQRLRMDRNQTDAAEQTSWGSACKTTVACSVASSGSSAQVLHGATCPRPMVPAPLVTIASCGGGGLASGTGLWMRWPSVMTRQCG
jgi:hypothetical protein